MDSNLRWPGLLAGLLTTLCLSTQLAIAEDEQSPKDDIAAQIRAQGYACDQPQSQMRKCGCCAARARATAFALYLTWRRGLNALINKVSCCSR
jgi:hypothetical protein